MWRVALTIADNEVPESVSVVEYDSKNQQVDAPPLWSASLNEE